MAAPATPSAAYKMVTIPEALDTVLAEAAPLPAADVPLADALGRTLAAPVRAAEPVPGFRASIKDGYAVASADGPGEFPVAFDAHAGAGVPALPRGAVAYIGTGGPLPEGADAVVQVEDTQFLGADAGGARRVRILKAVAPGTDVRAVGSDMAAGEEVLPAGARVGAAEVGILATVGAATVRVHRAPRVAVLSTGDEVVDPGARGPLPPGKVRDANRPMLLAAARAAGAGVAIDLGVAADAAADVEAALDAALAAGADVLLTSGGVSMGDKDFVKPLLERRGRVFFGKVLMKPGKPLTFARVDRPAGEGGGGGAHPPLLVFGLPGNPVSSLVTFQLVVLPCLRALEGWPEPRLRRVHARLAAPVRCDPERPEYHRAVAHWGRRAGGGDEVDGELVAASTGGQISSRLLSARSAALLVEVPRAAGVLPAGARVSALLLADLGGMPVPEAPAETRAPAS